MTTIGEAFLISHKHGKQRMYCPSCGEVRGSEQYTRSKQTGPLVFAHSRRDVDGESSLCPGGAIDLEEDRAP